MINLISVFTRGGAVLWSRELSPPKGTPVNDLIHDVMLEDQRGESSMQYDSYTLKWTFANDVGLVFVAVYLNLSRLLYVDDLLEAVKARFCALFGGKLVPGVAFIEKPNFDFDAEFKAIERSFLRQKTTVRTTKQRFFDKNAKSKEFQGNDRGSKKKKADAPPEKPAESGEESPPEESPEESPEQSPTSRPGVASEEPVEAPNNAAPVGPALTRKKETLAKLRTRGGGRAGRGAGGRKNRRKFDFTGKDDKSGEKKPKGKTMRKWGGAPRSKAEAAALDMSSEADKRAHQEAVNNHYDDMKDERRGPVNYESSDSEFELEDEVPHNHTTSAGGGLFSMFSRVTGKTLTEDDLNPVVEQLKESLVEKNVALEIADKVCNSVKSELLGVKMSNFTRTKTFVKEALEKSLLRIVTPKRPIDLLHSVAKAREENRPYTIVFIGVNGVGKSTSLAKVAHYLGTRNMKVSVAACDTFRSGAVEQLLTHARALGIRVFEQGYSKDPSAVCGNAVIEASRRGDDVVLIDTAGRMQDNEPLMRALSKLVINNRPDLVLFVGEALVGNDAVDQLTKFNRALSDLSTEKVPRLIDGIVLTKFDTVDDKVGAAISMTYSTGSPIVFIGTGQTYNELKRVHPTTLIRKLLK